jgi:uncharacterized membrane protein YvbJ
MYCKSCGNKTEDGKYCSECGKPLKIEYSKSKSYNERGFHWWEIALLMVIAIYIGFLIVGVIGSIIGIVIVGLIAWNKGRGVVKS